MSESKLREDLSSIKSELTEIKAKQKIAPSDFGAIGNGESDDFIALQDMLDYAETKTVGTEMYHDTTSLGEIVVDLCGKEYAISDRLIIGKQDGIGHINIINGTIRPTTNFTNTDTLISGNWLIRVGDNSAIYNYSANVKFENVVFDGLKLKDGVCVIGALNTIFDKCTFTNIVNGLDGSLAHTHETIIEACHFTNLSYPDSGFNGTLAIKTAVDTHINNNVIAGFADGILVTGGGNIIYANHLYAITGRGITTGTVSTINTINGNYLDSCPIELGRSGITTTVSNNIFLEPQTYAAIYVKNESTGNVLDICNITGNTIRFNSTITPAINSLDCTINGDLLTITTGIFTGKHIGAVSVGNFQISSFVDSNNVRIKKFKAISDGANTFWIRPASVSIWQYGNEFTSVLGGFICLSNPTYNGQELVYGNVGGIINTPTTKYAQVQSPIDIQKIQVNANNTTDTSVIFNICPRGFIVLSCLNGGGNNFSIGVGKNSTLTESLTNISRSMYLDSTYADDADDFIRVKSSTGILQGRIKSINKETLTIQWTTTSTTSEIINVILMAL